MPKTIESIPIESSYANESTDYKNLKYFTITKVLNKRQA